MSEDKIISKFRIGGMTCTSCEVTTERKIIRIPGVRAVTTQCSTGDCIVEHDPDVQLSRNDIREALSGTEYTVHNWGTASGAVVPHRNLAREIAGIAILVLAFYLLFKMFGIFSFDSGIEDSLSYGAVFIIGLVAAMSTCIAVVGGLVLTVSAKWKEANPNATRWQAMRPHLLFNLGRLVSYFVLGGVIGMLGTALSPSPRVMGLISIGVALVMILLALDILGLSGVSKWIPRLPKSWSHKIHSLAERKEPWVPFALGALTFFLPCGFTQSMQLYALTTGSFWVGGITMFVFALGTVPALLSIGAVASFMQGKYAKYFMKISGALIVMLSIYNFNAGATLAGILPLRSSSGGSEDAEVAVVTGETQVVDMAVKGIQYIPSEITIQAGVPVEWRVDGSGATGCTSILTIPSLNITERLTRGENVISFTPKKTGTLPFTCGMGMAYGEFNVVEAAPEPKGKTNTDTATACDPTVQNCIKP